LAEGKVFTGDSDFYKKSLNQYAAVTAADVRAAMQQWLGRPSFNVTLVPGDRPPYEEAKGPKAKSVDIPTKKTPRVIPQVAQTPPLDFPDVTHSTLSNGVQVHYAHRNAIPATQIALSFDAGFAADAKAGRGLQSLTLSLLEEGADGMTSQQIAEEEERLGAVISASGSADRSTIILSALSANLAPSLDLLADVVERPDFNPAEVDRVKNQTLTAIAQAQKEPNSMAARALPALLYGEDHPYATTSLGDVAAVTGFTPDDLKRFHDTWLRPDNMEVFIVSNLPLAELTPQLEQRFGQWGFAQGIAKGVKTFPTPPARLTAQKIYLIDRPGSPQSVIYGGQLTGIDPYGDIVPYSGANEVLGGNFLSRINMDLRETKGWSYGVRSSIGLNVNAVPYLINAPVQSDKTGQSIRALNDQLAQMLGKKGVTGEELTRLVSNNVDALPGRFETSGAVLGAMMSNDLYRRPDNYYELLADKYRGLTTKGLDQALKTAVNPNSFAWVVVGDARQVKPQLDKLGLPVEVIQPR